MEKLKPAIRKWISISYFLLCGMRHEIRKIGPLIFKSGVMDMLKRLFEAVEATIRAVTYLLVLLMGVAIAALGSYTIIFLAIRIGQFLWVLIFKEKWL